MRKNGILTLAVVVAALGYFVDIFDLYLFSIVRVPSLKALGVPDDQLLDVGADLLSWQMTGLLLGGILWGVLGDKRGRVSVLFGSILLYSLANLGNAFAQTVEQYRWLRLVAGFGLAGELGAAVTLVAESLPIASRGYATTIVASVGLSGSVTAAWVSRFFTWRQAYGVGGALGLALLLARVNLREPEMYRSARARGGVEHGSLKLLLANPTRAWRYLSAILIGVPTWCTVGILVTFAPEYGRAFGVTGAVTAPDAILYTYMGVVAGDVISGLWSQRAQSRRGVIAVFLLITAAGVAAYLFGLQGASPAAFYAVCALMGFGTGYWAVYMTTVAEQFGTNLRSTVTTTVPNFVRGSVVPITIAFRALKPSLGLVQSAAWISLACMLAALWCVWRARETYGTDLDFVEATPTRA